MKLNPTKTPQQLMAYDEHIKDFVALLDDAAQPYKEERLNFDRNELLFLIALMMSYSYYREVWKDIG